MLKMSKEIKQQVKYIYQIKILPITANISEADESRNVKIEVTDSLCNITKIKVARESEIKI